MSGSARGRRLTERNAGLLMKTSKQAGYRFTRVGYTVTDPEFKLPLSGSENPEFLSSQD